MNPRIDAPTLLSFELVCCVHSIIDCPVMSFLLIVSHCIASCSCPSKRDLCLPCLPFCGIAYCTSMHSNICLGASHLGTLDVPRVDVEHVLTEPNHKTVLSGHILKKEGPAGATEDSAPSRKGPRPC